MDYVSLFFFVFGNEFAQCGLRCGMPVLWNAAGMIDYAIIRAANVSTAHSDRRCTRQANSALCGLGRKWLTSRRATAALGSMRQPKYIASVLTTGSS